MKQKVWSVSVLGNKPTHQRKNIDFYTTDTKAELVFEITDKEMNPTNATISIYNKNDNSLVSEDHPVKNKKVTFPMYTTDRNVIEHNGPWVAQVVFEQNGGKYTSRQVQFTVGGNVLDDNIPSLDIKDNMHNLIYQLEQAVADAKAKIDEVDTKLKKAEATRVANETQRMLDETKRKANYQELLDTGVLQTNINTKLEALEEEYAPRLTELERFNINDEQHKIKFEVVNNQPRLIYGRAD